MLKQRSGLLVGLVAFTLFLFWSVSIRQSLLFLVGIGFGLVLAGMRFGFTTGWRNFIEQRDPSGILAQLLLLAIAAAISLPLLAAYPGELSAALGPPSISLLVGALVFGAAMQLADGCGSGTLYKAGLGIPLNMAILPMFALGSFLGSAHLGWWLDLGTMEPASLLHHASLSQALLNTFLGLGALAAAVLWWSKGYHQGAVFNRTLMIGAVLLALLAVLNLVIAGQPWGIVYGFGLWGAKAAHSLQLFDPSHNAFWGQATHAVNLNQSVLLDLTTITNLGILAGALLVFAGRKRPEQTLNAKQWAVGIIAGFILGYSSRLAFGCNVGAMVSGISTGSLHGWIWVALAFVGSFFGLRIRRYFNY